MKRTRGFIFVGVIVGLAGLAASCSKPKPDTDTESSKPIASPQLPEGAPTQVQVPSRNADGKYTPTTDVRLVIGTMGQEAQQRPKVGITAEPLFDALEEKANIKLAQRQQYMGKTMHAAFCAGGQTDEPNPQKLIVAMCEYPDDAAANASLEFMNHTFSSDGGRREAHHAAVLTIIASRAGDQRVDTAFKVFESL